MGGVGRAALRVDRNQLTLPMRIGVREQSAPLPMWIGVREQSAPATNVDWSVCKRYTIFCAVQSS